jgi:lysozyme
MVKKKKGSIKKSRGKKKSRKGLLFGILLPIGLIGFVLFWNKSDKEIQTSSHFHEIIPKGYKSEGIDVSHHQGEIDWDELFNKQGFDTIIDFVYCKATEGSDHLDTQWYHNRDYLNASGILNGAYHYFNTKGEPKPQAAHFLRHWKHRTIDLPPVLDVEDEGLSDEDLIAKIKIWCAEVQKASGVKPIIYTSLNFYETKFRGKLEGYQFWLAAYSREPQFMTDREVLHWQFSEQGKLPGMEGKVDLNVSKVEF